MWDFISISRRAVIILVPLLGCSSCTLDTRDERAQKEIAGIYQPQFEIPSGQAPRSDKGRTRSEIDYYRHDMTQKEYEAEIASLRLRSSDESKKK